MKVSKISASKFRLHSSLKASKAPKQMQSGPRTRQFPETISYGHASRLAPWMFRNSRRRPRHLTPDRVIAKKLGELLQERERLTKPQLLLVEAHLRNIATLPEAVKAAIFETSDLISLYRQNLGEFKIQDYLNGASVIQNPSELQLSIIKLLKKHLSDPQGLPPYLTKLVAAGFEFEEMFEPNTIRTCNPKGECITADMSEEPRLSSRAADFIWQPYKP